MACVATGLPRLRFCNLSAHSALMERREGDSGASLFGATDMT
jgi:hypothetical protein